MKVSFTKIDCNWIMKINEEKIVLSNVTDADIIDVAKVFASGDKVTECNVDFKGFEDGRTV